MQRKHTKYGPKFAKTDFFSGLRPPQERSSEEDERIANSGTGVLQNFVRPEKINAESEELTLPCTFSVPAE